MARSAVSAGARSTGGCAEHLRLRSHRAPRCWRHPPVQEAPRSGLQALADDSHAPLRADCLYAGSGHRTGVRGTGRGRYPRSVGEDPGQSAEPPSRGPRRPPIGGGFTWAHSWAHTVDAPPPHLRTRARVADVPPGRVGNPRARPPTRPVPHSGAARRHRHENPPSAQHKAPHTPAIPCRCAALNWNAFFRHLLPEHFRVLAGEGGSQGGGEGREPSERPARQSPQGQGNGPAGERRH